MGEEGEGEGMGGEGEGRGAGRGEGREGDDFRHTNREMLPAPLVLCGLKT